MSAPRDLIQRIESTAASCEEARRSATPVLAEMFRALAALLREAADALAREREQYFKLGWKAGYYDGGEHDCRMFAPSAQRAWEDVKKPETEIPR